MTRPIINLDEVELTPWGHGVDMPGAGAADERFEARIGWLGPRVGARKLGYNLTELPPGKAAFPLHVHRVNEEMFFVLSGTGEVRIGDARHTIRAGDVIACPPGGPEAAHQIVNTHASEPLRYLAVSTKEQPELVEYPSTGRFGILAAVTNEKGEPGQFRFIGRSADSLPYWDGE